MADLYNQSYPQRGSSQYHQLNTTNTQPATSNIVYPGQLVPAHQGHSTSSPTDDPEDAETPPKSNETSPTESKPPQKTQSTFLTKLYALLEKPENHHMIRWDPAGDHIIVERPEQLALHVLPSVYRQSRFASFSRQLNIYGFMRKVNLRNVDPAIDDPDASTWSHPTLNRHSPPEVVANFKRRVPPRLPKPRKRPETEMTQIPPPRSAMAMGPVPLTVPSSLGSPGSKGRARGFSAPGAYPQLGHGGTWGGAGYPRSALPPLTVPSDPPSLSHAGGMYGSHSAHPGLHPLTPSDESPGSAATGYSPATSYGTSTAGMQYGYPTTADSGSWGFGSGTSSSQSSLSSLLNPSGNHHSTHGAYARQSSYPSPYTSVPMQGNHSASSLSPDSRPTTGYSASSMSSLPYETDSTTTSISHDYSRPSSSHHTASGRSLSPTRPHSSHKSPSSVYPPSSSGGLSSSMGSAGSAIRRRRHSQAVSPYPSPYETHSHGAHHMDHSHMQQRPSTSPQPLQPPPPLSSGDHHHHTSSGSIPRVRSEIQLPSVDSHAFNAAHSEFAYSTTSSSSYGHSANHGGHGHLSSVDTLDAGGWGNNGRSVRPSTSASSLSAASHTSSSQANTPPVESAYGNGEDINRFSPDFGFVPLNTNAMGMGVASYQHKAQELTV